MIHQVLHSGSCSYCTHQGWLGFYVCGDYQTIVLICDECETIYLSPEDKLRDVPVLDRDGMLPSGVLLSGGRWANRAEVSALGWEKYVEGEWSYQTKHNGVF